MAKSLNTLPKGFEIDEPKDIGLPNGFEVDKLSVEVPQAETQPEQQQGDWDVLKGYVEKKQPKEFFQKYNEMNSPKWDKEVGRFNPTIKNHPEATVPLMLANGILDLKDITQGGATLLGKGLKGAFIDLPNEVASRVKNHEPLLTGQDFSNAWETTKRVVPQVGKAIIHPYTEALKGNFNPIMQNPLTTSLDFAGVGEVGKIAKLGKLKNVGIELGELASNPQKYVAKTERPIGLSKLPKNFVVDEVKPTINNLTTERPLTLNEFAKIQNEKLNQFAPTPRKTKVDAYSKEQYKTALDGLKAEVEKKDYATMSKKGAFWKVDATSPEQSSIIEAENKLNNTIDKLKKNPASVADEKAFLKMHDEFMKSVDNLPDSTELKDAFEQKYWGAVDEAESFNKTGYQASVRLPRQYRDYHNEYLRLYDEGNDLAKQATQEYFQKYGQKLKNPNYPKEEIGELNTDGLSSEDIFAKMKEENPTSPIFTEQEIGDKVGKIYNKHKKYSQAKSQEISEQINNIVGYLSDSEKSSLVKYLQDPAGKQIAGNVSEAAKRIQEITKQNTDTLIKGGYLAEDTAIKNPYKQAIVSRWIEENAKNFTPDEIAQMTQSGDLKTYANVTPDEIEKMQMEYLGAGAQPTYLNVNYGDRTLLNQAKQKLGLEPTYDIDQPVSILNKRKYGISPKVDVEKSLSTFLNSVEKLQANKNIVDDITRTFSAPLEEFGNIKNGNVVWSPDLIMQEIKEKGYTKSDDIIRDYLKKDPADIYRQSVKAGYEVYQVPENSIKSLSNFYYEPTGVDKVLNKLNQPFKRYALATGRFIGNNAANNLVNNAIEGVPLKAYNMANNPKLKGMFPAELNEAGFYGSEKNRSVPIAEQGINAVTNKLLPFKPTQDLLTKGINGIFNINSNIENSIFRANYAKQMQDLAKSQGLKLEEVINNPIMQDQALENTYKTLGDYSTKKPIYNAPMWKDGLALTSVVPFARPFVEQSKVMAHQAINRPLAFNAMVAKPAQIGTDIAQEQEKQFEEAGRPLKEYQKRALYQGYYYDEEGHIQQEPDLSKVPPKGKPVMYDSSSFLPHSIIGDYTSGGLTELGGKLNPLVGLITSTISGNKFGEIPLTAPNREWGKSLEESEKLNYLLSQTARTYTPAGMLEKVLPYKSYDSRLFTKDEKARDRTAFYATSKLLGGAEMVAPKIKGKSKRHKSKLPKGFVLDK